MSEPRLVLVLVLLAAACGAEATSTTPEPTAVPTTLATTTVAASTTLGPDECLPSGGGQTRRGFFCPPDLPVISDEPVNPPQFVAGTYRTRHFEPPFEFTREESFRSGGEHGSVVNLDFPNSTSLVLLVTPAHLTEELDLESYGSDPCFVDVHLRETEMLGYDAQLLDATGGEDCQVILPLEGGGSINPGERVHIYDIDADTGQLILIVYAPANTFDHYLEDTAIPLLDSVRFLDE